MAGTPGRRGVFLACVVAALAVPLRAHAQQADFFQALREVTAALEGTFGDEGSRVQPAIERLAASLASWDRDLAAAEASLRAMPATAAPAIVGERRRALGRQYADRGRLADALAELDAVVTLDPRRVDAHLLRGLILRESGRTADAIAAFRTARATDPGDAVAAYSLFHELALSGDINELQGAANAVAAAYLKRPQEPEPTKGAPFFQIARLSTASPGPPLVPLELYRKAYGHVMRREYERAIAEFRQAAAIDPLLTDSAAGSASMSRAIGALRQGQLEEARALLERSERTDSSELPRVLGLVYWAASDHERAIAALTTAVQRAPRNERARLALSRVLTSAGREADAELALQETLRVLPESALARWWLASAYERVNRFTDARREFERAAASAVSGESQLQASVGQQALAAADFRGATDAFLRAVNTQPNDSGLHRLLARALVNQDRVEEAVAQFIAALLIDPRDAEALAGIGQVHLNAGRNAEAASFLRRATDLSPANSEARYAFATALARLGRAEEAAPHFATVEQAQRQMLADRRRTMSTDVLKEEAALRVAEGRLEVAISLYEKALGITADPALYGQLSDLYAKVGRGLDAARAKAMYEAARREPVGRERRATESPAR